MRRVNSPFRSPLQYIRAKTAFPLRFFGGFPPKGGGVAGIAPGRLARVNSKVLSCCGARCRPSVRQDADSWPLIAGPEERACVGRAAHEFPSRSAHLSRAARPVALPGAQARA